MALTQISTAGVKDDAVTSGKIPANAVGSSELADNAVDTAAIVNDAVTEAKIANNAVSTNQLADTGVSAAKLANDAVTTAKIADQAVTLAKLPHGTSSNDGKFLRANNGADPTFETVTSTTINNNADNRVITGSGTANRLEAEPNLTFDNTNYKLSLGSGGVIQSTSSGGNLAIGGGNTNPGGQILFSGGNADSNIVFKAQASTSTPAERMRINSNGQLLIGTTTNPTDSSCNLRVNFDQNTSSGRAIEISHETNGADKAGAAFGLSINNGGESTNAAALTFQTASGGSLGTRMSIDQDIVKVHDGDIVIGTSGHGINFDTAGSGSDQLLDDYEEGTWTPGGDWDSVVGIYTKIGRVVHAAFQVRVNTSGSGNMAFTNLPFACANNEASRNGIFWGWNEFDSTVYGQLTGNINPGGTTMTLYRMDGSGSNVTYNQLGDNKYLKGVCCYQV